MTSSANRQPPASGFAPTRWSLVQRANGHSEESRAALSELCEAYWDPVFRYLRRMGHSDDAAREWTQSFFERVLAGGFLSAADPARGRFRSYLLGTVKHFLSDRREVLQRFKRGGGVITESLDSPSGSALEGLGTESPPDASFDRDWAVALMGRALGSVESEFAAAGKSEQFECLKPWIAGAGDASEQSRVCGKLSLSEGALKVAIHRIRRRFREAVRAEIRHTLPEGGDPNEELRYLVEVLSAPGGPG